MNPEPAIDVRGLSRCFGRLTAVDNVSFQVRRGEIFGQGLGASVEKLHYLPEAHTDFLLAVIGEELGFIGVASVILLFVLTANALRTELDVAHLFLVVVASCLLSVVGSVAVPVSATPNGVWNGVTRMTGWATADAPTFGTNVLVALLICVYFAFVARRSWLRLGLAGTAGLLAVAIVQTYARGIALVLVVSVCYLLFRIRKRANVVLTLAALLILVLCTAPLIPGAYYERMSGAVTQGTSDPTMGRRISSYLIGARLFAQNPLLGLGPGSVSVQYMSQEFRFIRSDMASGCFNLYLSVASQAGLLGLACLIGLLWSSWRSLRFVAASYDAGDGFLKQAAEILEIVLVALLLVSLFEATDLQKYLWIVLGAIVAVEHIRRTQLASSPAAS
jgi:O-antigen ligase